VPSRGPLSAYWVRALDADGTVLGSTFDVDVPVGPVAPSIAPGREEFTTVEVDDTSYRVHTIGLANGSIQVARSLEETDRVLEDLRRRTIILVVLVSVAAAGLGWLIAGTVVAPLRRLTRAAEDVGSTGRLDVDVPSGRDEVGRLGHAFRQMLDALGRSRADQQRLVEDAGHELRTPLTSLRTNLAVLRRHDDMPDDMRRRVLADLEGEVGELTDLVNEIVAVASGGADDEPDERFTLPDVVGPAIERVARRRDRSIDLVEHDPVAVIGPRSALERAATNLVDNAAKFDTSGAPIQVVVAGSTVTVLDRGPGVRAGDELLIFERFHRAPEARAMPGSGLGLAIVRDVVERCGGTVSATNRPGGGAAIGFVLPRAPDVARS
jgi:two-component system sensor histidine kinase MprB